MANKTWSICTLLLTAALLAGVGGLTALVDPFFHYHAPLEWLSYEINDQRYQNDGIVRHFDYDAIITGTSMAENFKTSEFDALFDANAVKVPFSGAQFKEINDNLRRALAANPDVRYIVRGLDLYMIPVNKDKIIEDFDYPTYLYDDRLFNDVSYLFNRDVLVDKTIHTLQRTLEGTPATTFDEYSNWMEGTVFGGEAVISNYMRPERTGINVELTDQLLEETRANVEQNLIALAREYPDVQFYYFYPPYSIFAWDMANQMGILQLFIDVLREVTGMLVEYENIHLFSFFDDYDLIGNLDLYKDILHYSEDVNSQILAWMAAGEHRLTRENDQAHWDAVEEYLTSYPFDALFEN